jgi:hypothetical protein
VSKGIAAHTEYGEREMCVQGARSAITSAVAEWDGVTVQPHCYGGVEFVMGRREIGHVHGDQLVDIPFPKAVRDQIVAAGRAKEHHILSDSGWVSLWLDEPVDVEEAIDLLRESYEIARNQRIRTHQPHPTVIEI